jgi:hypothetical protein
MKILTHTRYILFFLLAVLISSNVCNAQTKEGFLVRCYLSRTTDTAFAEARLLVSMFLPKDKLSHGVAAADTFYIAKEQEGHYLARELNKRFKNQLHYIKPIPKQNEFVETACRWDRKILLEDYCKDDFVSRIIIDPNYRYSIKINAVKIDFCALKKNTDFDRIFEYKIALSAISSAGSLEKTEREYFSSFFSLISVLEPR